MHKMLMMMEDRVIQGMVVLVVGENQVMLYFGAMSVNLLCMEMLVFLSISHTRAVVVHLQYSET